jgi:exodeoxyribonuclease-3
VILAGDYNVVPTDFDIYNPKSWRKDALLQPASRPLPAAVGPGLARCAARPVSRRGGLYVLGLLPQSLERNAGLRIDHLLAQPEVAPTLVAAGVDRWVRAEHKPSDHAPTWIELGEAARKPGRRHERRLRQNPREEAAKKAPKKAQTRKRPQGNRVAQFGRWRDRVLPVSSGPGRAVRTRNAA